MKNKIVIIVIIITIASSLLFWFSYTLSHYDSIFLPHYLIGLDNPNKYYQKNIVPLLLEYGEEYNVRDVDTTNWQIYQDQENKFKFKYPMEMAYSIENYEPNYGYGLTFSDSQNKNKCHLILETNWFGVKKEFLIKKRQSANFSKEKKENMIYIRSKDNNIYNIGSSIFYDYPYPQSSFTGITFWREYEQAVHFWNSGDNCSENLLKGVFATFEFIY